MMTRDGVRVTRTATPFDPAELGRIAALVDQRRGGVMSSGMEYPGRYSRWHMAYADPCAEIVATGRQVTALREITAALGCEDPHLGLYGAFGYDLAFQFEPVRLRLDRPATQRDLVLHLPDEIWVLDRKREEAVRYSYDFE